MSLRIEDHQRARYDYLDKPQAYAGYEVRDPPGKKIGIAEEVLANSNDEPEYIRVRVGFFGPTSALIPVQLVAADTRRRVLELR
jgi:hypothetical protein